MKFSEKISDAMKSKPGRLAQIKSIGFYTTSHRVEKIREFFKALEAEGAISKNVVFGRVNDTTVFFTQSEDEVVEKIREIPDKKTAPTSEKVLIKMLAARMEKIFEIIDGIKSYSEMKDHVRVEYNVHNDIGQMFDKILSSSGMCQSDADNILQIKFLLSGCAWMTEKDAKFNKIFESDSLPYPHKNGIPWRLNYFEIDILNDCVETFKRPEVTPELIRKAWDLHSVSLVMED